MIKVLRILLFILIAFSLTITIASAVTRYLDADSADDLLTSLKLPSELQIEYFAGQHFGQRLAGARMMAVGPDGHIYLSLTKQNKIVMLPDEDRDGKADKVVIVVENGLNAPHGLSFVNGELYVANQDGVVKLKQKDHTWPATGFTPIVSDLATGGHTYKTVKLGPDNHLYVNVGSSCNVCEEGDKSRATILRYTSQGEPAGAYPEAEKPELRAVWAQGLRNSQGFAWHPITQAMYATNEGADNRSETKGGPVNDALPPEHLNQIERGKHYGWPYCWGHQFTDPNFKGPQNFCASTQAPAITFTSHTTPIGFTFLDQADFPESYRQDAIVALHGSWNRQKPAGYQLVRVRFVQNKPVQVLDFITGWLEGDHAWGRPVDVVVGSDGALYVSDDKAGVVYRVSRKHGH